MPISAVLAVCCRYHCSSQACGTVGAEHDEPSSARRGGWPFGRGRGGTGLPWPEVALAVAAYAVLCVLVLTVAPRLVEPDDYAYRA